MILLTTEHAETHQKNIGIFGVSEAWGPWTTVCYGQNWGVRPSSGTSPINGRAQMEKNHYDL